MGRNEIRRRMLEKMPKGAVCAEVGVWGGRFSAVILEVTQPTVLHLIDPWEWQPEFDNSAFGKPEMEHVVAQKVRKVRDRFAGDPRVVIHRAMSHDALERFGDGELDWIYIDGNHNYEVVSRDLDLALAKVRPGGVIAGDDYFWNAGDGAPVQRAVDAFRDRLGDGADFTRMGQQYVFELAA